MKFQSTVQYIDMDGQTITPISIANLVKQDNFG